MPYIAIKTLPKDKKVKENTVEKLQKLFVESWNCPPEAITISVEEFEQNEYYDAVVKPEVEPKMDKMMIFKGEKKF